MTNTFVEKRNDKRLPANCAYSLLLSNVEYKGEIGNISLSGAFLATSDPELTTNHIAQLGKLFIPIDGNQTLVFYCEIVYAINSENSLFPIGAGVVFNINDAETNSSINTLLDLL